VGEGGRKKKFRVKSGKLRQEGTTLKSRSEAGTASVEEVGNLRRRKLSHSEIKGGGVDKTRKKTGWQNWLNFSRHGERKSLLV